MKSDFHPITEMIGNLPHTSFVDYESHVETDTWSGLLASSLVTGSFEDLETFMI